MYKAAGGGLAGQGKSGPSFWSVNMIKQSFNVVRSLVLNISALTILLP